MTEDEIIIIEKNNSGSSLTNNKEFDDNGYLILKSLMDPKLLQEEVPNEFGQIHYDKFGNICLKEEIEKQVPGSLSRYNYTKYSVYHEKIKNKIETIIQKKLYQTYFFDRFYFYDQKLKKHIDRDACEISLTFFISSNPVNYEWPFFIKSAKGSVEKIIMKPGDAVLYKGCERPHWRESFKPYNFFEKIFGKLKKAYFHQVFFHYVLSDGRRAHFAFDKNNCI